MNPSAFRTFGPTVLIAFVAVALAEALHVPFALYADDPRLILAVFGQSLWLSGSHLFPSLLYALGVVTVESVHWSRPGAKVVSLAMMSAGVTFYVYLQLVSYSAFRGYPPFVVALVLFFAFITWAGVSLSSAWGDRFSRARGVPLSAVALGAAVSAHVLNYRLYPNLYPTLHLAVLSVTYVLVFVGLVHLARRLSFGRAVVPWLITMATLSAVAIASQGRFGDRAKAYVLSHSQLGSPPIKTGPPDPPELLPTEGAPPFEPAAEAIFRDLSHMPGLRDGFRLGDYNVLFIVVEATRYDRTSLGSDTYRTTPNLARLVDEGAYTFAQAYSPSSGTFQTMSSLLAMTYPSMVALDVKPKRWTGQLREESPTVVEAFRASEYRTFWVGHNYQDVFKRSMLGLQRGFDDVDLIDETSDEDGIVVDARIAEHARTMLRRYERREDHFFGLVFFASPHWPYVVHDPEAASRTEHDRYLQEIQNADRHLGSVLAELKAVGHLDDTIVVFTSDHGEEFGEHGGLRHKATLYSEVTHVPLVIRVPGQRGVRIDEATSNLYVLPWLLLHGDDPARKAALERLQQEIGPTLKATDGAVVGELLGTDRMLVSLSWDRRRVICDLFAQLHQAFDVKEDPLEQRDLLLRTSPETAPLEAKVRAYRTIRGARFRYKFTP